MAEDRPSRPLVRLVNQKPPRPPTAAAAPPAAPGPCLRYHPPRHPDDDSDPDRPLGEFGSVSLGFAGECMRDLAQLLEDLASASAGATAARWQTVEVRVGTLQFIAESLREMGARCGETHRAEVLGHRGDPA
jgi:hypothetical protein